MATPTNHPHAVLYESWLRALERGVCGSALAPFFTADMVNIEHPNLLFPDGKHSPLVDVLRASERALHVIERQHYEVRELLVVGDRVAARVSWSGVLKVGFGSFAPGDTLRAEIAQFVTVRDGRIAENQTYDCYASGRA
jgi:ketosteroid isomerase-like protein